MSTEQHTFPHEPDPNVAQEVYLIALAATRGAQQPWHLKGSWLKEHRLAVVPCPNPVEPSILKGLSAACASKKYGLGHVVCHGLPFGETPIYRIHVSEQMLTEFSTDYSFCEQLLVVEKGAALLLLGKDEHSLVAGPQGFVEMVVGGEVEAYLDAFVEDYAKTFPSAVIRKSLCDLAAEYRRIARSLH